MYHHIDLIRLKENTLHHCAAAAIWHDELVVTAYYGRECTDEQRVFLWCDGEVLDLPFKTGNPVIWNENGKLLLMYSEFPDEYQKDVNRWKYCTNRLVEIVGVNPFVLTNYHEIKGTNGLLARCSPIIHNGKSLWPLYREKDPRCEIFTFADNTLKKVSHFGDYSVDGKYHSEQGQLGTGVAIQPTLFSIKDELFALCRNVSHRYERIWVSKSSDGGITWAELEQGNIPNYNSSIVAIQGSKLVLFNDTPTRDNMILMNITHLKGMKIDIPLKSTRRSASYPNYCWNKDKNELILVHSNSGAIAVHKISMDYLDSVFGQDCFYEHP